MSRHRSPGGRHRDAATSSTVSTPPRTRSAPRHRTTAVHHGMGAAAAGGALAALAPALFVTSQSADVGATTVALAVEGRSAPALLAPARDADGNRLIAGVVPISTAAEPEPPTATVTDLVKAAGLGDVARQADDLEAARVAAAGCTVALPTLGPVKPWARDAARFISCLFDDRSVLGIGGRGRVSDHPLGLAVDFMTSGSQGDRIARCVLDNQRDLGVSYVIWKQRINYGEGWEPMEDRGSITENHFDHVHVSFNKKAPDGVPDPTLCR